MILEFYRYWVVIALLFGKIMKIHDAIWGNVIIDSPILIKLVNSKTLERLKWIGQHGPLNHIPCMLSKKSEVTRYDHSIGAMVLTLIAGGTIDEAIAGLLHDIMHTAFSHALDFLLKSNAESYHEKYKKSLLKKFEKEMKGILGTNWKEYLNEKRWTLIKTNNPFAIDIAEYTVRDAVEFGFCDVKEARGMAKQLTIIEKDGKRLLACKKIEASLWWRKLSEKTNAIYTAPWNIALNHYLVKGLKECEKNGIINMKELKTVPNSDVENNTIWHIMNGTEAGGMLVDETKKWEFIDGEITGYAIVGEFDIRNRIVDPPIVGFEYITTKVAYERKTLAYCNL